MFEFRGAREAERGIAERGTASGVDRSFQQAMQDDGDSQQQAVIAQIQENLAAAQAQQAEAFRAQEAAAAMGLAQRQAGFDAYQAQLQDAANIARAQAAASQPMFPGFGGVLAGGLGGFMNRRIADQLEAAATRERFLGDRRLTDPVYGTTGRVTGVYDPYRRLTGRDPIAEAAQAERMRMAEAGQPEVTAPIQDPATGQQRCPDGYIFDEDLNACRLAPMDVAATTATPGEAYARTGLLDVAPEGLLDFQQRYGAGFGTPMDFEAANLAFRRQGATYPEYFRTAPKLDGYTLLS